MQNAVVISLVVVLASCAETDFSSRSATESDVSFSFAAAKGKITAENLYDTFSQTCLRSLEDFDRAKGLFLDFSFIVEPKESRDGAENMYQPSSNIYAYFGWNRVGLPFTGSQYDTMHSCGVSVRVADPEVVNSDYLTQMTGHKFTVDEYRNFDAEVRYEGRTYRLSARQIYSTYPPTSYPNVPDECLEMNGCHVWEDLSFSLQEADLCALSADVQNDRLLPHELETCRQRAGTDN